MTLHRLLRRTVTRFLQQVSFQASPSGLRQAPDNPNQDSIHTSWFFILAEFRSPQSLVGLGCYRTHIGPMICKCRSQLVEIRQRPRSRKAAARVEMLMRQTTARLAGWRGDGLPTVSTNLSIPYRSFFSFTSSAFSATTSITPFSVRRNLPVTRTMPFGLGELCGPVAFDDDRPLPIGD